VGQNDLLCMDHQVIHQQQIQIEGPRALRHIALAPAAEFTLESKQPLQQGFRRELRLNNRHGIQEDWLIVISGWIGLIK